MYMWVGSCVTGHVCRGRRTQESALSLYPMSHHDQNQVVRCGNRYLYPEPPHLPCTPIFSSLACDTSFLFTTVVPLFADCTILWLRGQMFSLFILLILFYFIGSGFAWVSVCLILCDCFISLSLLCCCCLMQSSLCNMI